MNGLQSYVLSCCSCITKKRGRHSNSRDNRTKRVSDSGESGEPRPSVAVLVRAAQGSCQRLLRDIFTDLSLSSSLLDRARDLKKITIYVGFFFSNAILHTFRRSDPPSQDRTYVFPRLFRSRTSSLPILEQGIHAV